ncbi:stalk domain-containing protein [Paenibacillus roseipurpureus]|uniref:Stalk domain-containing protein n=1 Tax=Paenibacillus roseopurpureus TaxID=2918901 RepID=A0AA96RKM7_9BACL|nr:stalk domain-containing protein [Paenibacillus sp. MBLB1832]WNR44509.1 stalk domain-containing protein [Paenibacillus sp. MBLB1832]
MKKFVLGVICGVACMAVTAANASDAIQTSRQVVVNGTKLDTPVQVTSDGTTLTSTRAIAEGLGAKVTWQEETNTVIVSGGAAPTAAEANGQEASFVSSLLHGKYSLNFEVISQQVEGHPDTTVVFSDGYVDVPENTDQQKLFLLLLVDQMGGISSSTIEFWSNKELAQAYVTGNYQVDGIEGWSGLNARFGLLTKAGGKRSLSHILSVHERDSVNVGMYK